MPASIFFVTNYIKQMQIKSFIHSNSLLAQHCPFKRNTLKLIHWYEHCFKPSFEWFDFIKQPLCSTYLSMLQLIKTKRYAPRRIFVLLCWHALEGIRTPYIGSSLHLYHQQHLCLSFLWAGKPCRIDGHVWSANGDIIPICYHIWEGKMWPNCLKYRRGRSASRVEFCLAEVSRLGATCL